MKTVFPILVSIVLATRAHAEIPWEWPSDPTFAEYAKRLEGSPYSARYIPPKMKLENGLDADELYRGTAEIVSAEGKVLYQWPAHRATSFLIRGDRLFCSDYPPYGPGFTMSCVDLSTQKVIWNLILPMDLPRVVLQFRNRVNVRLRDDRLFVFSQQSWKDGKFAWELSPETGKVLEQFP